MFRPGGQITDVGIAGGMGFIESIAPKLHNVIVNYICNAFGYSGCSGAALDKGASLFFKQRRRPWILK